LELSVAIILAFLTESGLAYYVSIVLPEPVTKNQINRLKERLLMFVAGTLLLSHVIMFILGIRFFWSWLILGIFYSVAPVLSYLGYVKWNVLWQKEVDKVAQMFMCGWDLGITLSILAIAYLIL
jgi:hypothetical protein